MNEILLDARITKRMSVGMIAYARELVTRLPRVAPDLQFDVWAAGGNFGLDEQWHLPRYAAAERVAVLHHLAVYGSLLGSQPTVVTIHDLIHLRYPRYFKCAVGPYYALVVRAVCARAVRVIVDDPRTTEDLRRFLGVPPAKVRVVPLGVDETFLNVADGPPAARPYFFYAGNRREHKDVPTLVAAWEALPDELVVDLVLTGHDDGTFRGRGRARGVLRFAGEVSTEELARLYRGAAAYVHPSLCEGFGLPLLEATATGTDAIACVDAIPAILADLVDAFEPRDVAGLTRRLQAALERPADPARRERLRVRAATYSWDRCAASTAEVYREVVSESQR